MTEFVVKPWALEIFKPHQDKSCATCSNPQGSPTLSRTSEQATPAIPFSLIFYHSKEMFFLFWVRTWQRFHARPGFCKEEWGVFCCVKQKTEIPCMLRHMLKWHMLKSLPDQGMPCSSLQAGECEIPQCWTDYTNTSRGCSSELRLKHKSLRKILISGYEFISSKEHNKFIISVHILPLRGLFMLQNQLNVAHSS